MRQRRGFPSRSQCGVGQVAPLQRGQSARVSRRAQPRRVQRRARAPARAAAQRARTRLRLAPLPRVPLRPAYTHTAVIVHVDT